VHYSLQTPPISLVLLPHLTVPARHDLSLILSLQQWPPNESIALTDVPGHSFLTQAPSPIAQALAEGQALPLPD
jgi:hypothetical protein